ncbi:uncharacterized protein B0T15DRAFT_536742 [Chaetomium strumarium]|uniref:ER membrane protein complex subunit 7 beta-sandwich domain-containing protein n=1 Tax=Chaetomium strumarium TaxID=1170767 RepID=A0AAJ0GR26_9PEZI|nr:hypothetical protein B0T15DRAFT_536742 [Chaetomium strumarium]
MQLKPAVLLSSLLTSLPSAILAAAKPTIAETTVTLHIPPSPPVLANPHLLPPSTHATLTTLGKALSAPLSTANTFVFHNVTPGSYLVDVHCPTHGFAPLRLDVTRPTEDEARDDVGGSALRLRVRAWETYRGNDWGNKGEAVPVREGGVLDVRVQGQKGYFVERSSFSVLSIFKNPIILLSLVSMGLFFGMPKLVENMDPEMRAEWEERQKENPMNAIMGAASGQNANPMGNFDMAAFLAGSSSNKAEEANEAKEGSGKGKGESRKKRYA